APTVYGPMNPPKLPNELIRAIPAAAEYPARNELGSEKKGPKKLLVPITANDHRAIENHGDPVNGRHTNAAPAKTMGMAAWYRRSSFRSELRETTIIAPKPRRCGIVTRTPIQLFDLPVYSAFSA